MVAYTPWERAVRVRIPALRQTPPRAGHCPRSSMVRAYGFYPSDVGSIPTGGTNCSKSFLASPELLFGRRRKGSYLSAIYSDRSRRPAKSPPSNAALKALLAVVGVLAEKSLFLPGAQIKKPRITPWLCRFLNYYLLPQSSPLPIPQFPVPAVFLL